MEYSVSKVAGSDMHEWSVGRNAGKNINGQAGKYRMQDSNSKCRKTEGLVSMTEGLVAMIEGLLAITEGLMAITEGLMSVTEGLMDMTEGTTYDRSSIDYFV
jgi:hypothetical protein